MTIAIVNPGIGNHASILAALRRVGAGSTLVTNDPAEVRRASAVILPGVGAFAPAMQVLQEAGLVPALEDVVASGRPMLGICLGMQLLARQSEEHGNHAGLGLIEGRVVRLTPSEAGTRIPHIGWADATAKPAARLPLTGSFYHVHSYHMLADTADVAATITYGGQEVVVAVQRNALFGVQFHPEKSQDAGLDVLAAFVGLTGS